MNHKNNNEVNNIAEFNSLHDILNTSKRTKYINIHYYPILHGCMNTRKERVKFENFESHWIVDIFPQL